MGPLYYLFIALAFVSLGLFLLNRRTPEIREAPRQVNDCEDTFGRLLVYGAGLLACLALLAVCAIPSLVPSVYQVLAHRKTHDEAPWFLMLGCVFGAGWLGRALLRSLRERVVARAGVLEVSEWPVAPGRRVRLQLTRSLRGGDGPKAVSATLSLFESVQAGRSRSWVARQEVALPEASLTFDGDAIILAWDVALPLAGMPQAPGLLFGQAAALLRWELHVSMPVPQAPELDSRFRLAFTYPPKERGR